MTDLKKIPLDALHREQKARMVPFAGYEMPVQYAGIKAEHAAVREAAGLFDVSHMGELFVEGPKAEAEIDRLITNDLTKLAIGKALYACVTREDGGILDDILVYRLEDARYLIICNAGNREKIAAHFSENIRESAFEDASDRYCLFALQGPKALEILSALGADDLGALAPFAIRSIELAGAETLTARTGYTGEDGFEILVENEAAEAVFHAIVQAGQAHGLALAGLGARDTLRLEAALRLYGNDIDEETNPLEAGLGFAVKLGAGDFIGKDALAAIKEAGPARKLIGFEMTGRGIARSGYPVLIDGEERGVVTSGSPSPTLNKNIGLCYLPRELAEIGRTIEIAIRDKKIDAKLVETPFYKRVR